MPRRFEKFSQALRQSISFFSPIQTICCTNVISYIYTQNKLYTRVCLKLDLPLIKSVIQNIEYNLIFFFLLKKYTSSPRYWYTSIGQY